MYKFFLKQDYQIFKTRCGEFLSDVELPFQISEARQNEFLDSVKTLATGERFSFVVDLLSLELTHCTGADRWLGYPSKQFSMYDYLKVVHPNYVGQLIQMAIATLEITNQRIGCCNFLDQRIIVCLPIREKSGKYWWVKRESTAFQFDAKGRMTAYANLFTIVKEYQGEAMGPRYSDQAGNTSHALYEDFVQRYRERARKYLPFTKRQFEILTIYANFQGSTSLQVGEQLAISKQTIEKHNQGILSSARHQFLRHFGSAIEVAYFLREGKII